MKILVIGANGLLGKELIKQLSKEHVVYSLVSKKNTTVGNNIIKMDLTDIDEKYLPSDMDVIYYLAQSNHFREFPDGAMDMLNINVYAPVKLVNWAQKNGVKKFIYASSGGVYKNPTEPVQEFFDINANEKNGFYLDSKLSAEMLLRNFSVFFETFVIVRPFFMYGPNQNQSMLVPRLINNVFDEKVITLSGKEGICINPIYVDDAASAMVSLLNLTGEYIFNIAGIETVTLKELARKIGKIVGKNPIFTYTYGDQADLVADISMMKEKLIVPKIKLDEGLLQTFERISESI